MIACVRLLVLLPYFLFINVLVLLVCVARPFHRNNVHLAGKLYSSMSRIFGLKLDIRVPTSVKRQGPFIYVGNHQNSFDLITVCGAAQPGTVTVGKKSLIWIPVFGWVYWLSGNILIDRNNTGRARDTILAAAAKVRKRRLSVWLFPEGTRSYGRGLLPFKTGAFRLAKSTNEPVVMVCASNLHNKIKLNRWDNGTLIISLSDPVTLDDSRSTKEWAQWFREQMKQTIEQLDKEVAQHDVSLLRATEEQK
ncbi:1-acylglycerol-3-phosphate O-acyltransferase [Aestuariibacter halophilus]|uniref:1-acyl-sn-glycerol-3-phosphate acyltransferase n=1 Tax=Fluctibacter halophilus TaxID=226011 RepID=A0ABS8GDQ0_9ALTE|nr:1-acylglycerol-3-phosphate O-acyltransferase [Aestuariibacter halophilus]MCC2617326.1 1-acylglycerol-3-phosphate O-acyltransferase [Aestuariibacter halophilus]